MQSALGASTARSAPRPGAATGCAPSTARAAPLASATLRSRNALSVAGLAPLPSREARPLRASAPQRSPSAGRGGSGDAGPESVMVAVDLTENAYEGVSWASEHLCRPGQQLEVLHVLCDKRPTETAVGASASGRVTRASIQADWMRPAMTASFKAEAAATRTALSERMEQMLPDLGPGGEGGTGGLTWGVGVKMVKETKSAAVIGQAVVEEAAKLGPRALVIVSQGFGLLAEYGSVARYCCHNYKLPLVLVPPSVQSQANLNDDQILVAANTKEEVLQLLEWTSLNAACPDGCTVCKLSIMTPEALGLTDEDIPDTLRVALRECGIASLVILPMDGKEILSGDSEEFDSMYGAEVCERVAELRPRMALAVSYAGQGMLREMMYGSMAMYCSKHCTSPLVLLQPEA